MYSRSQITEHAKAGRTGRPAPARLRHALSNRGHKTTTSYLLAADRACIFLLRNHRVAYHRLSLARRRQIDRVKGCCFLHVGTHRQYRSPPGLISLDRRTLLPPAICTVEFHHLPQDPSDNAPGLLAAACCTHNGSHAQKSICKLRTGWRLLLGCGTRQAPSRQLGCLPLSLHRSPPSMLHMCSCYLCTVTTCTCLSFFPNSRQSPTYRFCTHARTQSSRGLRRPGTARSFWRRGVQQSRLRCSSPRKHVYLHHCRRTEH